MKSVGFFTTFIILKISGEEFFMKLVSHTKPFQKRGEAGFHILDRV